MGLLVSPLLGLPCLWVLFPHITPWEDRFIGRTTASSWRFTGRSTPSPAKTRATTIRSAPRHSSSTGRSLSAAGERQPLLITVVLAGLALANNLLRLQSEFDAAGDNISRRTARMAPGILDDLGSEEHAESNQLPAARDETDSS